jgi:hypothetical protein
MLLKSNHASFPDAQLRIVDAPSGAGPESITTMVVMDSLMCNCTSKLARKKLAPRNDGLFVVSH